jgi:thymidylate synthase
MVEVPKPHIPSTHSDPVHPELQYLHLLDELMTCGSHRLDRTGVGTVSLFGRQMRFDLAHGFPILTTKKVLWRHAFVELLWFLRGETNIRPLLQEKVTIWSDWPHRDYVKATGDDIDIKEFERRIVDDEDFARRWGDLGPVYGSMWRRWRGTDGREHDQVAEAVRLLREDPASRRIIVEGWNVGELDRMIIPPCHKTYQFWTAGNRVSVALYQRSADVFLGLPFNIVTAALFLTIMAEQAGLEPGELVWFGADTHLYSNHVAQAKEQIGRTPRPFPRLEILHRAERFDAHHVDDFRVTGYDPHPTIAAPVAL